MNRRVLGWALVVYGVLGLVLVVAGAFVGLETAGRVERLAGEANATLAAATEATRAAADSFENIDGSLSDAQSSSDAAARLAREASATLDALAIAMELSVFGAQPLLPLAGEFAASADQASALAGTLDDVGNSLADTRTDVTRIGVELEQLSVQLDLLGDDEDDSTASPPLRLFVGMLLAWLAVPAVGALIAGLALIRRPREPAV